MTPQRELPVPPVGDESLQRILSTWRYDYRLAVRQLFDVEPDPWQDWWLHQWSDPNILRHACKASKGPGKTALEAWCGLIFTITHPFSCGACVSVTGDNLRDNLWTEFARWMRVSKLIGSMLTWNSERIAHKESPDDWWISARTWPRTASVEILGQTLAGLHAKNIFFLVDEAGSVPAAVLKTVEAALANADVANGFEAKLGLLGNPDIPSGPLYEAFTSRRHQYDLHEVTGDPLDPKRSPRISIEWAQQMIDTYGREDPWVMANILGLFPPLASNQLFGIEELSEASRRHYLDSAFDWAPIVLGVDVARFGDDRTVIIPRQGLVARHPTVVTKWDTVEITQMVARKANELEVDAIFIDTTGGLGAGPYDQLRHLGYPVHPVEFGSKPGDARYQCKRDEIWFAMRDWVREQKGVIPNVPELITDLAGPTYTYAGTKGKVQVESKDELKKRGLRSPDYADALACTFAFPIAPRAMHGVVGQGSQRIPSDWDPYRNA